MRVIFRNFREVRHPQTLRDRLTSSRNYEWNSSFGEKVVSDNCVSHGLLQEATHGAGLEACPRMTNQPSVWDASHPPRLGWISSVCSALSFFRDGETRSIALRRGSYKSHSIPNLGHFSLEKEGKFSSELWFAKEPLNRYGQVLSPSNIYYPKRLMPEIRQNKGQSSDWKSFWRDFSEVRGLRKEFAGRGPKLAIARIPSRKKMPFFQNSPDRGQSRKIQFSKFPGSGLKKI